MRVYTYSEARQKFSSVLNDAESNGKAIVRRKDGRTFAIVPEQAPKSPLDIPTVKIRISTRDLVGIVRAERRRARGWKPRRSPAR